MDKNKLISALIRWNVHSVAKGVWWLITPWRMKQRLHFVRERQEAKAAQDAINRLFDKEKLGVVAAGQRRRASTTDLFDLKAVASAVGIGTDLISWTPVLPGAVDDRSAAARFCIDLLRARAELRRQFPTALSSGSNGAFAHWILDAGGRELGLSHAAQKRIVELLSSDFAARARQAFLTADEVRAVLPHGLTPVGQIGLFEWFIRRSRKAADLSLEEVWWLFLQASEDPVRELHEAFRFTPHWQQLFPDGLTVFGRDQFAAWFSHTYGTDADWADPSKWPLSDEPATDLRIGYWAHEAWRDVWPRALIDADQAKLWIEWLGSSASPISEPSRRWCRSLSTDRISAELTAPGVNILGHFCYPSGLQVSVQSLTNALILNGVPLSLRDVKIDDRDEPKHAHFHGMEAYDTTILHVQPEPHFRRAYERAGLAPRLPRSYRVAYWYWEFESIPQWWEELAEHVDEIWTATEFIAQGIRKRFRKPVRVLMPGVCLAPYTKRSLEHFGLDSSRYTFLFTFNMMSVMERKNPLGLIRAFRMAFSPDEPVSLVLKSSFGDRHPEQLQQLHVAAAGASIRVIDEMYSSDEVLSLMDACDAYVSLHRSEGLGLTMAEAMLMGKPVIATRHSGNVDFMDDANSLLVDRELVPLGRDIPPYGAELEWANPSEAHAAHLMRRLYENQTEAKKLGQAAMQSATARLSLKLAGQRIACRLEEIKQIRADAQDDANRV